MKIAAEALNIQHYTLPKLTGTCFVGHRISALRVLLDMWPAIITALQNVQADHKTKATVRANTKDSRNVEYKSIVAKTYMYYLKLRYF